MSETAVARICPWIKTTRIGSANTLVTYGELNALPDYLVDPTTIAAVGPAILVPILQVIRQEGYNRLKFLRNGTDPGATFALAACSPWKLTLLNQILDPLALDELTEGLGTEGEDHFQGLLARNACHFAPFSWYRWKEHYLIGTRKGRRLLSHEGSGHAQAGHSPRRLRRPFPAGFLQPACYLVNKTLVMQWFIEWAADQSYVAAGGLGRHQYMTTERSADASRPWAVRLRATRGPSNDPQASQETATLAAQDSSAVGAASDGPRGRYASYQNYLTFVATCRRRTGPLRSVHDHFNETALWVSSAALGLPPYQVWGDYTFLLKAGKEKNMRTDGLRQPARPAQLSALSLSELIEARKTPRPIMLEQIRARFPIHGRARVK